MAGKNCSVRGFIWLTCATVAYRFAWLDSIISLDPRELGLAAEKRHRPQFGEMEGVRRLMESNLSGPVNIGSEEMVTINQLAELTMSIANKRLSIRHIGGPLGVRGRNSDNKLIEARLKWKPSRPLVEGLMKTYRWVSEQVRKGQSEKRIAAA
jgi:hypothetical protein